LKFSDLSGVSLQKASGEALVILVLGRKLILCWIAYDATDGMDIRLDRPRSSMKKVANGIVAGI